jgi:16S rRNA G1207 methylase RsmC
MLELLAIQPNDYVLEPSAGKGAIVQHLWDKNPAAIYMIEKNAERAKYIKDCYPSAPGAIIWHDDFLTREIDPGFDRIIMNPPFEEMQDVDHVKRAYDLLSKDGRMVSVMSESSFFRTDRKAAEFREWLDEVGGYSIELPDGSFKESGTGVKARLVVIRK